MTNTALGLLSRLPCAYTETKVFVVENLLCMMCGMQMRVHNFATHRSLPLEVVRRIVPTNGHTHKGRQLLKTRIDRGTVVKLCREFERKR